MGNNKKNSLLILDDEANLEFLFGILSPEYTIYGAKNASSALEMAQSLLPDVILLDTAMADINGLEVLAALKASEITRNIPVITTGHGGVKDEEKGVDIGASDYMPKPFSATIVKSWVMDHIQYINKTRASGQCEHNTQPAPAANNAELPQPITLPYARVLVVDDVEINIDVAMGMMHHYEMQIDGATSGQQAIDAIREEKQKYNAIFMDHIMPGIDGLEATRIIREEIGTEYARNIPIIALTADGSAENEELLLSKGFQAFIPKPIDVARLDAVMRQWVQDKEAEKSFVSEDKGVENEQQISIGEIEGLDREKGLERFGGRMEIYLQVLRSFSVNARPLVEAIRDVSKDNLKDYAITVHGLKGSCWGVWAKVAGNKAEALENAAKAGDLDFVAANNQAFIEVMSELIANIEDAIRQEAAPQDKLKKDKPDREILSKILAACEDFNMTEADALIKEIEEFEYGSDDGLALWLRENADQMNWFEIAERLTEWLETA